MTVQYNFDEIIDRRESDCLKWHQYREDVLPMWVADMDFRSPAPVIQALHLHVDHGVFGYPETTTRHCDLMSELSEILIERMANRYSWKIQVEDLFFLPGVVTGFNLACHALSVPDGGVFFQTPIYHPILHAGIQTGCQSQEMELTHLSDGSYSVDWDLFEMGIDDRTRLFIQCNPHNPVGKVFSLNELERSAEICLRKGITICSDEIHCDLIFKGSKHIPIASLDPEIAQHTITLMAPSKTYNLAGLQFSFAIIQNPELRARFVQSRKGLVPSVNLMGFQAGLAAYRDGGEWLDQVLDYLEQNRDFLVRFIRDEMPQIKIWAPQGTYLAWLDCRNCGIEGSPGDFFLEHARVAFNEGSVFGSGGQGFVRMNFGCPRSLLEEGLNRMKAALIKIQPN